MKVEIMMDVIRAKFCRPKDTPCKSGWLVQKLLDTKDAHLQEGNTWGDEFWGCVQTGFIPAYEGHPDRRIWAGRNMLGHCLMQRRRELGGT